MMFFCLNKQEVWLKDDFNYITLQTFRYEMKFVVVIILLRVICNKLD